MTIEEDGWQPYPGAGEIGAGRLPPAAPGRAVSLGAICDLGTPSDERSTDQHFRVSEFVLLNDGRRVILHQEWGFTLRWRTTSNASAGVVGPEHESARTITQDALTVVLPDDDGSGQDRPFGWLAELAQARMIEVTADDLRCVSYEVVFTETVRRWLAPD